MTAAQMNVDEALLVADAYFLPADQGSPTAVLAAEVRRQHAEIELLKAHIRSLDEWQRRGDGLIESTAQLSGLFRLGEWWADRPWRAKPACAVEGASEQTIAFMAGHARGVESERLRCAWIARHGCLVPPDGGSPTEAERLLCEEIERRIRAEAA